MTNEPTDNGAEYPEDLDAFSNLLNGKTEATVEVKEAPVENDQDTEETSEEITNDDPTDEDAQDEDDDSEDQEEDPKPKRKNRLQERINDLTARAKNAERALEALQKAQEAPKQSNENDLANKARPTEQNVQEEGPRPDDKNDDGSDKYPLGDFDPNFHRDQTQFLINQALKAEHEKSNQLSEAQKIEAAREDLQNQWVEKLTPAVEKYDDFFDKTVQLEDTFSTLDANYSQYLADTIKSLDHGPEVLYYFANNLEEAQKFVQMGPLQATLALGEVNALFKGQTRKETKVSNAPPPPQVNKGSKTRVTVTADTDDLDAFEDIFFKKK